MVTAATDRASRGLSSHADTAGVLFRASRRTSLTTCSICDHLIPPGAMAFLEGPNSDRVLCWRCRDTASPLCPYCAEALPRRPKRQSTCRKCSEQFRVHSGVVVTDHEASLLGGLRCLADLSASHLFRLLTGRDWVTRTTPLGNPPEWVLAVLEAVSTGRGRGLTHSQQVCADALNRLVHEDPELALGLGHAAWEMGLDYRPIMRRAFRIQLDAYAESSVVRGVKVLPAPHSCRACLCLTSHDRIWSLDDALREEPLPCRDCTSGAAEKGSGLGWCRCAYIAVLDDLPE